VPEEPTGMGKGEVGLEAKPTLGHEEGVERRPRHTSAERAEPDSALRADSKETGAMWQANASLQQAAYGNPTEARQSAAEALKLAPTSQGVEVESCACVCHGR